MRQRFIQSFSTSGTEHEAIDNELLGKPYVAYIRDGQYIDWNTLSPTPPVPPEPTDLIVTYNVTSTTKATRLMRNTTPWLTKIVVDDGTEIPAPTGSPYYVDYKFATTGQHTATFIESQKDEIPSFDSCITITSVYIPEGYTKLGMLCFELCTGLTSINIPNSVTAITNGTNFLYCNRLRTVNIGTGIKVLGDQVFMGCTVLSAITINAVTPPTIGSSVLTGVQNAYFYVPDEAVDAYKAAPSWASYANRVKGISEKPQ